MLLSLKQAGDWHIQTPSLILRVNNDFSALRRGQGTELIYHTTGKTHLSAAKQKHAQFRHLGQELLLNLIQITILQSLAEIMNELKFMRISAQTLMKPGFISNVVAPCRRRFKWILLPYAVLYPLLVLSWELCTKMKNSTDLAWKFRNSTLQMLSCWLQIHIDPHLLSIWKWHIFAEHWEKKLWKCLSWNEVFSIRYLTISRSVAFFCYLTASCVINTHDCTGICYYTQTQKCTPSLKYLYRVFTQNIHSHFKAILKSQ